MKNLLFEAIKKLAKENVDFVICGGIACILQGSDRNSLDLDLNINMSQINLTNLVNVAQEMGWKPRVPVPIEDLMDGNKRKQWIEEKNALVFTLLSNDGMLQIDIFLSYPIGFETLKKDANIFEIDDIKFAVSSKEHLIQAKESINPKRQQDDYDINILKKIIKENER